MPLGFFDDEHGKSSKRLVMIVSGVAMGVGTASLLFAKAWWVLQHGGDCSAEVFAGAAPVCAMAGVAAVFGKPKAAGAPADEPAPAGDQQ